MAEDPTRDDLAEARRLVYGWFTRLRGGGAEEWRRVMVREVSDALACARADALHDRDRGRAAALRLEAAAERWRLRADAWKRVAMALAMVLAAGAGALAVVMW